MAPPVDREVPSPRRVLVTGGAGFIGSHVAAAHAARGNEVHVVDDLSTGRRENVPPGAHLHVLDLRDAAGIDRLVADVRPQVVSHHAAQASVSISMKDPRLDAEVNILGGLNLLEACRRRGPAELFVFASTGGAIYGDVADGHRARTTDPRRPDSPYGIHKSAFEELLRVLGPAAARRRVVLRYANVYGARQRGDGEAGVVAIFAKAIAERRPITLHARDARGDDGCVRDYVHIEDVVRAHRAAEDDTSFPSVVNVSTGVGTTTRALLAAIEAVLGPAAVVDCAPPRDGDLGCSVLEPGPCFLPTIDLPSGLARTLVAG